MELEWVATVVTGCEAGESGTPVRCVHPISPEKISCALTPPLGPGSWAHADDVRPPAAPGPLRLTESVPNGIYISQLRHRVAGMRTDSSMLHVRMDTELKRQATAALSAMGLTASEAVRLFFHRIAVEQAFPLELKVPNAQTRRAMAESEEMMRRGPARFASADEMFAELEEARGQ